MKMGRLIIALVIGGTASLVLFATHVRVQQVFPGPSQLLQNDSEAYIFLQRNQQGWNMTLGRYLFDSALSLFGRTIPCTNSVADVVVYRLHDGAIETYNVSNFSMLSQAFPYEGRVYVMYYENGKADQPRNYRWNGNTFVPIGVAEAVSIRSAFRYTEDLLKKEGWKSQRVIQEEMVKPLEFNLGDSRYTIDAQASAKAREIRLSGPNISRVLITYEIPGRSHMNSEEYAKSFSR